MSVSVDFGLTESGKSYNMEKNVIPQWDKVIVFDNARCFKSGMVFTQPTDKVLLGLFKKLSGMERYVLIIRPGEGDTEVLFNKTVKLALALGKAMGLGKDDPRVAPEKRVQMITDEADFVCSPNYQSKELKHLVNKGRHDNVDSHFIARSPMRIHTDIRVNASKITTFRLQNALEIPLFKEAFGAEIARKIRELPKYWRLEWKDNGETTVYNAENKIDENFLGTSQKIQTKKRLK